MSDTHFNGAQMAVMTLLGLSMLTSVTWAASYSGGAGTVTDPYQITTAGDWQNLFSTPGDWNKYFILTADIDFLDRTLTPVGNNTTHFSGQFDGKGHVVRSGKINIPDDPYAGLFGYLGSAGQIRNLGVEDMETSGVAIVGGLVGYNRGVITSCFAVGAVSGFSSVGGLVGTNSQGTLTLCYAAGSVSGGDSSGGLAGSNAEGVITQCCSEATVSGAAYMGGLVGSNGTGSSISLCYATGTVSGGGSVAGGLVGGNSGAISFCYARGATTGYNDVGGLVGQLSSGTITVCYSTGSVTGTLNDTLGGLVGASYGGTVSLSYWDRDTSGRSTSSGGDIRTTDEMTYTYAANTYLAWDFTGMWAADTDYTLNDGYPYLGSGIFCRVEADVAPRSHGDGSLLVNDWVEVGRFVAGLDTVAAGSEFQRADCAPVANGGDGQLLVNDWVQAGRYIAGLDSSQAAHGPTSPSKHNRAK